ncbi:MAG: hypothetical protein ACI4GV_06810, partial [Acutalibacteraceae bacterium]
MKKFTAIIAAALAALAITVPVFAENDNSSTSDTSTVTSVSSESESSDKKVPQNLTYSEYKLSDIGMNIKLPDSMYILTRDMKDNDPSLKACNLTKDEVMDSFEASNTYIKAIEKNFSYDITVTIVKNSDTETVDNLTSLSDDEIQTVIDNLLNQSIYTGCSKSMFNNTQFLTLDLQYDSSNTKIYGIQEYTVIKGTKVVVTFQSYDGEISDSQKSLLNTIMNSVTFDGIDSAEQVSATASTSVSNLDIRYIYIIIASVVGIAALAAMIIVLMKYRHGSKMPESSTDKPEKPTTDKSDNAVNIEIKAEKPQKTKTPKEQPHTENAISKEEKTPDDMFDLQSDAADVIYDDKKEKYVQQEKPQENIIPYLESSQNDDMSDSLQADDNDRTVVDFINSVLNEKKPSLSETETAITDAAPETSETVEDNAAPETSDLTSNETETLSKKPSDETTSENQTEKFSDKTNDDEEIVFAETDPKTHTKIEQISENKKDEEKSDVKPDTKNSDDKDKAESEIKTETEKDNEAEIKSDIQPETKETTEMSEYEKRFGKNRITTPESPAVAENDETEEVSKFEKYFGKLTPVAVAPDKTEKAEVKPETPVKTEKTEAKPETPVKTEKAEAKPEPPVKTEKAEAKPETPVKTEKAEAKPEPPVKTEKTEAKPETTVKTEKAEVKPEPPVKTEKTEAKPETTVKTEKAEVKPEPPVKTEKTEAKPETTVKTEKAEVKPEPPVKTEKAEAKPETSVKTEKAEVKPETAVKTEKAEVKPETAVKTEKAEAKPETPVKTEKAEVKPETAVKTEKAEAKPETPVKTEKAEVKPETAVKTEKAEAKPETPVKTEKAGVKPETPVKTESKEVTEEVLSMNSQNNVNGNKEENEEQKEGLFAKLKTKLFMENNEDIDYYDIQEDNAEKPQQSEAVPANVDDDSKNTFWQKVKNKLKNNPDEQDAKQINNPAETEKAPIAKEQTDKTDNQNNKPIDVEIKKADSVQNTLTYSPQQKISNDTSVSESKYERIFGANRENKKAVTQTVKKPENSSAENKTADGKQIPLKPVIPTIPTVPVVPVAVPEVKITKKADIKVSAEKPETEADFFEGIKPVEEKIVNSTEDTPKATENKKAEKPSVPEFNFERDTGIVFEHAIPGETPLKANFTPFTNVPRLENVNADEYNKKMEELKKTVPQSTQSDFEKRFGSVQAPKTANTAQKNKSD